MPHDQYEIEGIALELIHRAKCDPRRPLHAVEIAGGLGMPVLRRAGLGRARLVPADELAAVRIEIPTVLSFEQAHGAIAHEVAEWTLFVQGYRDHDTERECDRLARAMAAPLPAFTIAVARAGLDLEHLAARFLLPQIDTARRYAEATGTPTAIVSPAGIERCGKGGLPDDRQLRAVVHGDRVRGVRVVPLPEARRWMVVAA